MCVELRGRRNGITIYGRLESLQSRRGRVRVSQFIKININNNV